MIKITHEIEDNLIGLGCDFVDLVRPWDIPE